MRLPSGKGFFLAVAKINTQESKYRKGKSSYCVQDTSGISKMILKYGKYAVIHRKQHWSSVNIRYINSACMHQWFCLPWARLFCPFPVCLPALGLARGSKYLLTLFQDLSLGSFHQLRMTSHKGGIKEKQQHLSAGRFRAQHCPNTKYLQ